MEGSEDGLAALGRIEGELGEVERALARLDEGSYGRCRVCDGPIPDPVLAADPTVTTCTAHGPTAGPVDGPVDEQLDGRPGGDPPA